MALPPLNIADAIWHDLPPWVHTAWLQAQMAGAWVSSHQALVGVSAAAGFLALGAALCRRGKRRSTVHGSAAFATPAVMASAGLFDPSGVVIGSYHGRTLYAPTESNVLVMGPPGTGKTAGCVLETIDAWKGDLLVLALKQSLLTRTRRLRAAKGPVYVFEPTSTTTHRLNPLDAIPWQTRGEVTGCRQLAEHVAEAPAAVSSAEGAHYDRVSTAILATVSLYVGLSPAYDASIPGMLACLSAPGRKIPEILVEMAAFPHRVLQQMVGRLQKEDARTLSTDWLSAVEWLTVWDDPDLAYAMTSPTTIPWTDLQQGDHPMTIYFRVSADDAKHRLQGVLRLLFAELLAYLTKGDPRAKQRELLIILDDAAELERMVIIQSVAAFGREFGIRLLIIFQSPMQVWESYGRYASLFNTCSTWVMYQQNDPESSGYISRKLGPQTVEVPHTSKTVGGGHVRRSQSTQLVKRDLLTPEEIDNLDPQEVLICHRGIKVRGQWRNAYEDPRFSDVA